VGSCHGRNVAASLPADGDLHRLETLTKQQDVGVSRPMRWHTAGGTASRRSAALERPRPKPLKRGTPYLARLLPTDPAGVLKKHPREVAPAALRRTGGDGRTESRMRMEIMWMDHGSPGGSAIVAQDGTLGGEQSPPGTINYPDLSAVAALTYTMPLPELMRSYRG
jgi:hypothetical protein